MQPKEIKKSQEYMNKRTAKILVVEDYCSGLVVYHYLENTGSTKQATEQYFCKNMVKFERDYRKCNKCGWAGLPDETLGNSRGCIDENGDLFHVSEQCCPKCHNPTCYDKNRQASPARF